MVAGLGMAIITLTSFRLPNFMKHLEKADARFMAQATDDSQRRAAIEQLSEVRRSRYRLAILGTAGCCFIFVWGLLYPTSAVPEGAIAAVFGTVMAWWGAMKSESDLRLLKVVDNLKR